MIKLSERDKREWRSDCLSVPLDRAIAELKEGNEDDERSLPIREKIIKSQTGHDKAKSVSILEFVKDRMVFRTKLINELEERLN